MMCKGTAAYVQCQAMLRRHGSSVASVREEEGESRAC